MRAIGVDVGGTTIKIGVCHPDGTLTHARQVPTPRGVGALVALVAEEVARLRAEIDAESSAQSPADAALPLVSTVAVVVPGIVDERTGTAQLSVNLDWRDVPMRALLTEAIGGPVVFGHDVRAGALAEARVGAGRGADDLLFIPLGTGIAGALVLGGAAFTGRPWAGELGQVLVPDPAGGAAVTLERVASAAAVARRYLELVQDERRPSRGVSPLQGAALGGQAVAPASESPGGSRMVFDRARTGDEVARAVIAEAVRALAEALATVVAVLGPLRIVVGGGMAAAGEELLAPLRRAVAIRLDLGQLPEIVPTGCGPWAGCIGAGLMALDVEALSQAPLASLPTSHEEHGQS